MLRRGGLLGFAIASLAIAVYVFFLPALIAIHDLRDPALRAGGVPRSALRLFHNLTPSYETWARARVASQRARQLDVGDIAGTEWPVFGSVFYLWAVEAMQAAWEQEPTLAKTAPRYFARGAVDASVALVLDDGHAAWVKRHWGATYLDRGNAFYRALRIAAMTSHVRLTGESTYRAQLGRESEGLASEIDQTAHGLLDDYPGQCYPSDVLVAWAIIKRAEAVLGVDQSARLARALRGFLGSHVDGRGLVPYACDTESGLPLGESRGCSNSYVLLVAAELWPAQAQRWYESHARFFWQWRHGVAGFREFPADAPGGQWYADVDAGPVIAGHGVAATAFGLGAALVNGRRDHAQPLLAELFAVSWPLPSGTLLLPRILSNATDAPYLGEAAVLYILTRQPVVKPPSIVPASGLPGLVYIIIGGQLLVGSALVLLARVLRRRSSTRQPSC